MGRIVLQHFKINIPADDATYKENQLEFRKDTAKILGFVVVSKQQAQVDLRGTLMMEINGKEIYPEETDAKIFTTNASIEPEKKYTMFKNSKGELTPLDSGSGLLRIHYRSEDNALLAFVAHDVTFTYMTELVD